MPGRTSVRPEKKETVKKIKKLVDSSPSIVITDYNGMTVKQVTDLRRSLRKSGAEYKVLRNRMSKRAFPQDEKLLELFKGPVAIVFSDKEVVEPAKQLVEFAKENEKPKILGGLLDEKFVEKDVIVQLSKLPSREELLTKVVQCMNGPMYGFVNVLAGTMRKLIYGLNALKESKGSEQEKEQEEKGGEK